MNFLAHAYLSFSQPKLMVGNFIADFVKGNDYQQYPEEISRGIIIHREIDYYTDNHPQVLLSKRRLQPKYRHYAGVIVDMYYDHFLAANFQDFHNDALHDFAQGVYRVVADHRDIIPPKVAFLLKHMSRGNWLLSYAEVSGIEQALGGISRRTKFKSHMEQAGHELREHYEDFHEEFNAFFPEIIQFVEKKINQG